MKEQKSDKEEIKKIETQVWRIIDTLRGSIRSEDLDVTLFILSAYNDGLFEKSSFISNEVDYLNFFDVVKRDEKHKSIFKIYAPIIQEIPSYKMEETLYFLNDINPFTLQSNFSQIFDSLLYRLSDSQSRFSGEFIQPLEITRFMITLANLDDNATIYNPFAGLASFGTFLKNDQRYYAQEINQRTWALGMLRLMAFENTNNVHYDVEDSIKNWNSFGEFDLIVSNPPFGLRLSHDLSGNTGISVDRFIIEKSIERLPKKGQLICILPQSFLYSSSQQNKHFRRELIENNFIDTIISLPSGILKHTSISVCIVVFKKHLSNFNKIRFVNATEFVNKSYDRKGKTFDDISLTSSLKFDADNAHIRYIDINTVRNQNFNLNVNRYFIDDKFNGVRLGDIGHFISGSRSSREQIVKYVKIPDLKDDVVNSILDFDSIELREIPFNGIRKIEQDCLLVAIRWKTLKPTFFKYAGEPIYISNDIIAIKIDESMVNINYLINELHADYVKDQLNGYRITGVIPMILRDDLFNIKIELPSLEKQTKKYYSIANDYIKSVVKETQVAFDEKKLTVEDENSFLRHQIAGSLKNVRGAFKFVQRILEEKVSPQFPNLYDLKVSDELETTLATYLKLVERDLNSMNKSVNRIGDKIELMDLKIENFDLLEFISEYAEALKIRSQNFYSINLDLDENAIKEFGISAIHIEGDKDILRKMLDNIVENAEKHAFTHGINNGNDNKLKIELLYNFEFMEVQIDICNTGNSLPENITYDAITRKGNSSGKNSGDGIGLWFAKEVMEIHKGRFGFTDETGPEGIDSDYVTSIELIFPILPAI